MRFNGLTKDEAAHARELIAAGRCSHRISKASRINAQFYTQAQTDDFYGDPNFTIAVLYVTNGKHKPYMVTAVAKRDPLDKLNVALGRRIALARALSERAQPLYVEDIEWLNQGRPA